MTILLILLLFSFLISILLTPVVRDAFHRLKLLDRPDDSRKLHQTSVPRVGGIPLIITYLSSLGILYAMADLPLPRENVLLFIKVSPAIGLVFLTGLLDDLRGLSPVQKLAAELAAAVWAYYVGVRITGAGELAPWLSFALTVIWLVGCTNAFNLIDGLDGLAAGIGLLATLTIVVAALIHENLVLAISTVPLAGGLIGFLRYNFTPASIFLGDCGSLFVGFLLACLGVIWSQKAVTLLGMTAPVMALAIPVLDVMLSIVRRYLRRQPIFVADHGHIHHRLLAMGLRPREVAIVLYGAGGLAAAFSLLQSVASRHFGSILIVLFCAVTWAGIQRLRYVELDIFRRMLMGGEFRRMLSSRIRLQLFQDSLANAKTADECWLVIRDACRDFGVSEVVLKYGDKTYDDRFREDGVFARWRARVPLSASDYIDISTPFRSAQPGAVEPLLEVLQARMQCDDIWISAQTRNEEVPEVLRVSSAGAQ